MALGASTREHPAPFPLELAYRLVRMFSFHGDTVLDPFCGSGTTMLAAIKADRNSIGVEIDPKYCKMIIQRLNSESASLFNKVVVKVHDALNLKTLKVVDSKVALNGHNSFESVRERLNRKLGPKKEISKLVTFKP